MGLLDSIKTTVSKAITAVKSVFLKPEYVSSSVKDIINNPVPPAAKVSDYTAIKGAIGPALTATAISNPALVNTVINQAGNVAPKVVQTVAKAAKSGGQVILKQPLMTTAKQAAGVTFIGIPLAQAIAEKPAQTLAVVKSAQGKVKKAATGGIDVLSGDSSFTSYAMDNKLVLGTLATSALFLGSSSLMKSWMPVATANMVSKNLGGGSTKPAESNITVNVPPQSPPSATQPPIDSMTAADVKKAMDESLSQFKKDMTKPAETPAVSVASQPETVSSPQTTTSTAAKPTKKKKKAAKKKKKVVKKKKKAKTIKRKTSKKKKKAKK